MSVLDFNDGERQSSGGDVIPNGTLVRVIGVIRPGGVSRPGQEKVDGGYLTASKTSDVLYLSWEFTVVDGPFARRKFWQNMTVAGGQVNERGESKSWNITKTSMRAMLCSARNIRPDDMSDNAASARRINTWGDLDGIEFAAKVGVSKGSNGYPDKNQIAAVIEPDNKAYGAIMNGEGGAPVMAAAPMAQATWAKPAAAAAAGNGAVPAWAR
jgi:hypothetical protein